MYMYSVVSLSHRIDTDTSLTCLRQVRDSGGEGVTLEPIQNGRLTLAPCNAAPSIGFCILLRAIRYLASIVRLHGMAWHDAGFVRWGIGLGCFFFFWIERLLSE